MMGGERLDKEIDKILDQASGSTTGDTYAIVMALCEIARQLRAVATAIERMPPN